MNPTLASIFGFQVQSYGLFLLLGIISAGVVIYKLSKEQGQNPETLMDFIFWGSLCSIAGARTLNVIENWGHYSKNPIQSFAIWDGGLVFYGGLIATFFFAIFFFYKHKLPVAKTLDIVAPGLALGHVFGRIGCFLAGCCHGSPTDLPWAVTFPEGAIGNSVIGIPVHPAQLYISACSLVLFLLLMKRRKSVAFPGELTALYLLGYATYRFIIEFVRADLDRTFFFNDSISISQLVAIILAVLSLSYMIYMRKNLKL